MKKIVKQIGVGILTALLIIGIMVAKGAFRKGIRSVYNQVNQEVVFDDQYEVEHGFICDKYYQFAQEISDTEDLRTEVKRIHDYCPGDVMWVKNYTLDAIVATIPNLKNYDFDHQDHILTYVSEDGHNVYIYIKKITNK